MFPKLKSVLKEKRFLDVEDIKSSAKEKKKKAGIPVQDVEKFLNSGRSAGYIVKNWRESTLKNSMSLISAALKINS
jgi:predicted ATP-dependent endonuclease of OLD family